MNFDKYQHLNEQKLNFREMDDASVVSKAGWTPYAGRRIKGGPVMTFVRGELVAENGRVVATPGTGRWVRRGR